MCLYFVYWSHALAISPVCSNPVICLFFVHSSQHTQVPEIQCIMKSFKKLTRACWPKSQKQQQYSSFLSDVEDSQWLNHLSTLLQLSVAVADLINIQGSSVLVALEKGMDITAQVTISILPFAYIRTIIVMCCVCHVPV